ncbi:rho GTPase-activating protein 19-like isoform X1 [Mytilus trossulus]|uniref:rho GTPase-activating protein 19-like isoform X1 n=2 Tax=Mytilus trossulus TaxID=6551 RepID=UPI00300671A1
MLSTPKCAGRGFMYCSVLATPTYDMSTPSLRLRQSEAQKNICRLRNCMPEKFQTLVRMHLSIHLDLDGSKLDEMFSESKPVERTETRQKKSSTPFSRKKSDKQGHLFGSPLTSENVAIIYKLIEFLGRPENITTEGLFRKTGNVARQRLLKQWLSDGSLTSLDDGTFSHHDCATVLKNYLGELPDPLLTEKNYEAHLQIVEMGSNLVLDKDKAKARSKQLKTLQLLFLLLPPENSLLLECLIDLLHKVTKTSGNMMTAQSLGTLFAPHLLCSRKLSATELQCISPVVSKAVAFMIEYGPSIFKIPKELAVDVANFWKQMETPNKYTNKNENKENLSTKKIATTSATAIDTVFTFVDRKSSSDSDTDTQVALAKLYAHVQSMPESARKKKLLKQFNNANGLNESCAKPRKHHRSRTFGEQIKKRFSRHKRRGSNDPNECTAGLPWTLTKPINIDENDNSDNVFIDDKPSAKLRILRTPNSPAVHIVDLCKSPATPRNRTPKARKRLSSGSSDGSIPEKRPTPEPIPSLENEIQYLIKNPPETRVLRFTPELHGKPVAMVSPLSFSPISNTFKDCPQVMKKAMNTPRSRAPVMAMTLSPSLKSRESQL